MRIADSLGHTFSDYFIACINVSSVIRGTLHNIATFNSLNNYYHNGCCASIVTINYVHAFKRRRRKSSNSYNDIQFLRCNCNSWFNCMDLLLNVMYMKKTAEIPQQSFFIPSPITSTLRN